MIALNRLYAILRVYPVKKEVDTAKNEDYHIDRRHPGDRAMKLKYTYTVGKKYLTGYLDDYPEYPTQGRDLEDLKLNLLDMYEMIQDGTLEAKKHGSLQVAG
jgi:hypothetical protein